MDLFGNLVIGLSGDRLTSLSMTDLFRLWRYSEWVFSGISCSDELIFRIGLRLYEFLPFLAWSALDSAELGCW